MTSYKKALIAIACIAAAFAPLAVHYKSRAQLAEQKQLLRAKLDEIPQLRAEHDRLSYLVEQVKNAPTTPRAQMEERTKLRKDVGALQKKTNQLGQVAASNLKTSTELLELAQNAIGKSYDRASFSFVGFNRPEDTLQSMMYAVVRKDLEGIYATGTPGFRTYIENEMPHSKEELEKDFEVARTQLVNYRITDARVISSDMIILYAWFDYRKGSDTPNYGAPMYLKKVDGLWKLDDPQAHFVLDP